MALKHCRECGKDVSSKAAVCPHCGIKKPVTDSSAAAGCLGLLVLIGVIIYFEPSFINWISKQVDSAPSAQSAPAPADHPDSNYVATGETGVLKNGSDYVFVAASEESFDRLSKLLAANDKDGWAQMILAGDVMPVKAGTQCLVIDPGIFKDEVRILEGQFEHQSGFVPPEFVVKR
jgi:RNA polymerase subunit RPABC4/transcription elongation factor Spt4